MRLEGAKLLSLWSDHKLGNLPQSFHHWSENLFPRKANKKITSCMFFCFVRPATLVVAVRSPGCGLQRHILRASSKAAENCLPSCRRERNAAEAQALPSKHLHFQQKRVTHKRQNSRATPLPMLPNVPSRIALSFVNQCFHFYDSVTALVSENSLMR